MTEREKKEVVRLRKNGLSFGMIAKKTGLAPTTIKSFIKRNADAVSAEPVRKLSLSWTCRRCGAAIYSTFINIAPEGHDLQPNDAEKLARNAIMQKYGWSEESILDMDVSISFHLMSKEQSRIYTYWFYTENNGSFRVVLESPSGRVRECKWVVDPAYRALPAGDLSDYVEAAKEFIEDGCFELLSPAEKGSVAQRYYSAGFELLLPDGTYVIPEAKDISEGDAVKIAQNALIEQYGFCKEDFSLFTVRSALTFDKADRVWIISYNPRELDYRLWRYDAKDGEDRVIQPRNLLCRYASVHRYRWTDLSRSGLMEVE